MKFKISLNGIDSEFERLFKLRTEESKKIARKEVNAMISELKANTPVDTGFARDSWSSSETDRYFIVENSAEYIEYLNEGSSKQAPARFIEAVALKYGDPIGTIVEVKS